jgi:acylphosphatase
MKMAAQILVKGRVQGVGFRWFAMREAESLGITGYVKNLVNGQVEIFVEGERDIVQHFKQIMNRGPSYGRVDELDFTEMPFQDKYRNFSVEF